MKLENFLKIPAEFENTSSIVEEKIGKQKSRSMSNSIIRNGIASFDSIYVGKDFSSKAKTFSERFISAVDNTYEYGRGYGLKVDSSRYFDYDFKSCNGSMRKEKEWKRTLACKLFEERHSVDGGEGMDSLWEAYENDSIRSKLKNHKNKKNKKGEVKYHGELGKKSSNLGKISKAIKGIGWLNYVTNHSKKVHNNGDRY